MSTNQCGQQPTTQKKSNNNESVVSFYDPAFKNLITVPMTCVYHLPSTTEPQLFGMTLCTQFDPRNPLLCTAGALCKSVHVDLSAPQLVVQSVHVNYTYQCLDSVIYERLPFGADLIISGVKVPSERVLVTAGVLESQQQQQQHSSSGSISISALSPHSHCANFINNKVCNDGARCRFAHVVCPTSVGIGAKARRTTEATAAAPPATSNKKTKSPAAVPPRVSRQISPVQGYRHNPYSVLDTILQVNSE